MMVAAIATIVATALNGTQILCRILAVIGPDPRRGAIGMQKSWNLPAAPGDQGRRRQKKCREDQDEKAYHPRARAPARAAARGAGPRGRAEPGLRSRAGPRSR